MLTRILKLMNDNNVKASKLCEELGISASSITDWKKGKGFPSVETTKKISIYFNVSLDWLITGEGCIHVCSCDDIEILDICRHLDPTEKTDLVEYIKAKLDH